MTMSITKERNRFIRCSLLSDCKNVQKSALKSVNVQRTGKSILQMFAFSFFEGSHICRFLCNFAAFFGTNTSLAIKMAFAIYSSSKNVGV